MKMKRVMIVIFKERKLLKVLGGILFTTSLSLLVIAVSLASVTEYSSLKPLFSDLISKRMPGEQLSQYYTLVLMSCEKSQTIDMPMGIERITLQCSDIKSAGKDGFSALVSSTLFDSIYYKEYSCGFIDCVKQSPLVILSQHANAFMNNMIYMMIILTIISAVILAISSRNVVKSFGTSLLFVGLSYFVVLFSKTLIPAQIMDVGGGFINPILDAIAFNFMVVLVAGAALTASWLLFGRKKVSGSKKK